MMKKAYLFLIALSVCSLLWACNADDPENLFGVTEEQETTSGVTVPQETIQTALINQSEYQYGNMQKNVPSGNFARQENTVLFTFTPEFNQLTGSKESSLYVYDLVSGEVSLFCKDATCQHRSSECAAAGVNSNLEQYGGRLYGMQFPGTVMELKDGRFEPVTEGTVRHFWHSDGNLYAMTADASLVVYENGSDKSRILLEEYSGYWETIFDGYLYFSEADNVNRINLRAEDPQKEVLVRNTMYITDGQHIYYTPEQENYRLYRCDMDGSNPTLLLDKPVLTSRANFDEEYFYFLLNTKYAQVEEETGMTLCRFPKADPTQVEKIAELDGVDGDVYTMPGADQIIVSVESPIDEDGNGVRSLYIMGTDGGNPRLLTLPQL